jgi:hypothetical protein
MTRFCPASRAFIAPSTGLLVLTEEACARWFAGDGDVSIWEGWRR